MSNRLVPVDQAPRSQRGHDERRNALRGREDRHHRVALPRQPAPGVTDPAPQVDDRPTVAVYGDRGADVPTAVEVSAELVRDPAEALVHVTGDPCHSPSVPYPVLLRLLVS